MARPAPITAKYGAAPAAPRRPARKRPIALASLRGFESAARHLSFTQAADELHLTQSAVSRQVAALETDVGHRLFIRKTRALVLTPAGERLLRSTRQALGAVDQAVEDIRGRSASQRVVLTTYPSFASLWLVPRLALFQRAHPGIEIRIDAQPRPIDLEVEGVDIALRRCRPQDAPRDATLLLDEDVTVVLSAELLNRFGGRVQSPADLLRLPRIAIEDDLPGDATSLWSSWFEHAGVDADAEASPPVMVVAYTDQSLQAAARGQGVVLAYAPFREEFVANGQLVMPFPEIRLSTGYSMFLIANRTSRDRAPVAQLRNWLLEEFTRPAARQT
ncbi:MAG TPA: LysR substrate-binding domain-containing protein [Burkholderiaceae bacterium]|jgi:LysR family glycine cleavage system transcriptional activator|nr:LysR substrate-binding domain-containing protein [Burkholderiaceae bacterium]